MTTINTIRDKLARPSVLKDAKISIALARRGIKLVSEDRLKEWFFFRLVLAQHLIKRDRPGDIEKAIEYMQEAQKRLSSKQQPRMWAETCVLLAMAYERREKGKRENNVERALKEYENALGVFSEAAYPELWATIKRAVGDIYSLQDNGNRLANIRQAIENYDEALRVFSSRKDPDACKDINAALTALEKEQKAVSRGTPHSPHSRNARKRHLLGL